MGKLTELSKERRKWILKTRAWLGLCRTCGKDAPRFNLCNRCRERKIGLQNQKRAKRKEKNLCQECGKIKIKKGEYYCDDCIVKKFPSPPCRTDGCDNITTRKQLYCNECKEARKAERQSCRVYFVNCPDCDVLFTVKTQQFQRCNRCVIKRLEYIPVNKANIECDYCGEIFKGDKRNRYCSDDCRRKVKRWKWQRRLDGYIIENVSLARLFYRDHGRCKICSRKLNLKRKVPHKMAATIDHIIPLSKGGMHEYKNTQLACFMCNSLKGNGTIEGGEQLLLIGL